MIPKGVRRFSDGIMLQTLRASACGEDHVAISVGIGGLSGFCSGLAQTGGPPIVGLPALDGVLR